MDEARTFPASPLRPRWHAVSALSAPGVEPPLWSSAAMKPFPLGTFAPAYSPRPSSRLPFSRSSASPARALLPRAARCVVQGIVFRTPAEKFGMAQAADTRSFCSMSTTPCSTTISRAGRHGRASRRIPRRTSARPLLGDLRGDPLRTRATPTIWARWNATGWRCCTIRACCAWPTISATIRSPTACSPAVEAVRRAQRRGPPVILSDGDAVFQPRKWRAQGFGPSFEDRVLIYVHKEQELADVERFYPAATLRDGR